MTPAKNGISSDEPLATPRPHELSAAANVPPGWQKTFWTKVPLIGIFMDIVWNAMRYGTTLEDCADFIAEDLEKGGQSEVVGCRVGVVERAKDKSI